MKVHLGTVASCFAGALALCAGSAEAQDEMRAYGESPTHPRQPVAFIEATGAYGVQFGETPYLPAGAPGDYQHPIVHGFGVGGTAGVTVFPGLSLIANYEYANSRSREGSLAGVIDEVQVSIDYHTIVVGLRLSVPTGFGSFQAELAGGVLLPFQTEANISYGPALGGLPMPITGTGTLIDHYSVGYGAHGLIGYRIPIFGPLYTALNVKVRTFQSENSGERTELRNYVTDFTAQPPVATTADVVHGDGAAMPSTTSVQDVRLQLAIGAEF